MTTRLTFLGHVSQRNYVLSTSTNQARKTSATNQVSPWVNRKIHGDSCQVEHNCEEVEEILSRVLFGNGLDRIHPGVNAQIRV